MFPLVRCCKKIGTTDTYGSPCKNVPTIMLLGIDTAVGGKSSEGVSRNTVFPPISFLYECGTLEGC